MGSIYFVLPKSFAKPYRMVARIWTIFFWSHTIGIAKWIFNFKTKRMVWNCVQYRVQPEFSILVILVRISLIFSPSTMRNYFLVLDFVSKHEIEKRNFCSRPEAWNWMPVILVSSRCAWNSHSRLGIKKMLLVDLWFNIFLSYKRSSVKKGDTKLKLWMFIAMMT